MTHLFTINDAKNIVTYYSLAETRDLLKRSFITRPTISKTRMINEDVVRDSNQIYLSDVGNAFFFPDDDYQECHPYYMHKKVHYLSTPLSAAIKCSCDVRQLHPRYIESDLQEVGFPLDLPKHELEYIYTILKRTATFEQKTFYELAPLIRLILSLEEERFGDYESDIERLTIREACSKETQIEVLKLLQSYLKNSEAVKDTIEKMPLIEEKTKTISMLQKRA